MKTKFIKSKKCLFTLAFLFFLFINAGFVTESIQIEIDVSPNVLNLDNQATIVTVHTDISYSIVVGATVTLNNVEIDYWKSDDRGNFVAKFLASDVKDLPLQIDKMNTLTMTGLKTDGGIFWGEQAIKVIKVSGKR